jgi:hypothetical protein
MKIVAIRNCSDPAFIVDNLTMGPDPEHPFREFPSRRLMVTNFEGSANIDKWYRRLKWIDKGGFRVAFFEGENEKRD